MRDEPSWRRYSRFWRPDVAADIDDELRFHFDARVEELVEGGMTLEAAWTRALEEFGDAAVVRARLQRIDNRLVKRRARAAWLDALRRDLRYTLRGLRRDPGFTAAVVPTLGVSVGAAVIMFGIVDRLLFRPPAHVREPDRIIGLHFNHAARPFGDWEVRFAGYPDYAAVRDGAQSFEHLAAFHTSPTSLGTGLDARPIRRTIATASFFPLLGVQPERGRFFTEEEDRVGAGAAVAVVAHHFWRRKLGGDPAVLGKELHIGDRAYTIIGVAPPGFTGVDLEPVDVWLPMSTAAHTAVSDIWHLKRSGARWLRVIGRLRPGVTAAGANAEATRLFRRHLAAYTRYRRGDAQDSVVWTTVGHAVPARDLGTPRSLPGTRWHDARIVTWVGAMSMAVLLVACGNVANLLITRAARRRRELAVRVALGLSRRRLVGQLLMEGAVLALLGGAAGVAVAAGGGDAVRRALLPDVAWDTPPVDARAVAFAALATLVAALLIGLPSALQSGRSGVIGALTGGLGGRTIRRSRIRRALLLFQVATLAALLLTAGLFVRSVRTALTMDMGYQPDRVLVASIRLGEVGYRAGRVKTYFESVRERVRVLPGVESVALSGEAPFYGSSVGGLRVPGRSVPSIPDGGPYTHRVTPEYFGTLRLPIVRGRGFSAADSGRRPTVAIVSQTMARLIWPGEDPIGQCLKLGSPKGPCTEVVGVARDAHRHTIHPIPVMQLYIPEAQDGPLLRYVLLVRVTGDASALVEPIRREMHRLAPNLALANVHPLRSLIGRHLEPWRLGATVLTACGILGLAIVALGLYAVVAYEVTQRSDEFGLRMALGASAGAVVALVLRQGMGLAVTGVALGGVALAAASKHLTPLLFQTSATDPAVFTLVAVGLLGVFAAAIVLPARRATRVDPVVAMRAD